MAPLSPTISVCLFFLPFSWWTWPLEKTTPDGPLEAIVTPGSENWMGSPSMMAPLSPTTSPNSLTDLFFLPFSWWTWPLEKTTPDGPLEAIVTPGSRNWIGSPSMMAPLSPTTSPNSLTDLLLSWCNFPLESTTPDGPLRSILTPASVNWIPCPLIMAPLSPTISVCLFFLPFSWWTWPLEKTTPDGPLEAIVTPGSENWMGSPSMMAPLSPTTSPNSLTDLFFLPFSWWTWPLEKTTPDGPLEAIVTPGSRNWIGSPSMMAPLSPTTSPNSLTDLFFLPFSWWTWPLEKTTPDGPLEAIVTPGSRNWIGSPSMIAPLSPTTSPNSFTDLLFNWCNLPFESTTPDGPLRSTLTPGSVNWIPCPLIMAPLSPTISACLLTGPACA